MKKFTEADLVPWAGGKAIQADRTELVINDKPLLQTARSGYGKKLNTGMWIHFAGRLYRIYATCYSNAASHWFTRKGQRISIY